VIVLTGESRENVRREALLNGASIVLGKPVDPLKLLDEIQALDVASSGRQQIR
jgi:DNA-binding response OmpR family regulator